MQLAPPQIVVSYPPAMLVRIDGRAVMAPVPGHAGVQRVQNTRAAILLAERLESQWSQGAAYAYVRSDQFYLRAWGTWLTASTLAGPWSPADLLPRERRRLDGIVAELAQRGDVDAPDAGSDSPGKPSPSGVPRVFVTETPAELVLFDGPPAYVTAEGTRLVRAANADHDVLLDREARTYYLRAGTRWLAAPGLDGPWRFVPDDALPPDLARLPARAGSGGTQQRPR